MTKKLKELKETGNRKHKRIWLTGVCSVAAVLAIVLILNLSLFSDKTNVSYADSDQKNNVVTSVDPQVKVPVDLKVEQNDQKNADAGSSPWKLDPIFVSQVFVSLKISPDGITGEYPISEDQLKAVNNNGSSIAIEVNSDKTDISKVYLKRLVKQDSTGIWTVVGYDQK